MKAVVGAFQVLDGQHLCQAFVQGYYCMIENALDKLAVGLCDEMQFHLFGITIVKKTELSPVAPLISVEWAASAVGTINIIDCVAKSILWAEEQ